MTSNLSRLMAVVFAGALTACGGTTDGTDDTDTDTDGGDDTDTTACNPTIKTPTLPAANATDVYFRTPFAISFQQEAADVTTFALTKDSDSSAVATTSVVWSTDGKNAAFELVEPLEASTAYTLTVTYSCNSDLQPKIQFTTDATGTAVEGADFLEKPYALDLSTATIIEPAGVQALLGQLLGQLEDAIIVVPKTYDTEEGTLEFFGGLATVDGGSVAQDECTETIVFEEAADFGENPYWEILAPNGISLSVSDITIELLSLELSGAFNPDASAVVGVQLEGQVDTRAIAGLLGDTLGGGEGDDAVCTLIGQLTGGLVACEECPGGEGPYCLSLKAANIRADKVTGAFIEIFAEDIAANPECPTAQ